MHPNWSISLTLNYLNNVECSATKRRKLSSDSDTEISDVEAVENDVLSIDLDISSLSCVICKYANFYWGNFYFICGLFMYLDLYNTFSWHMNVYYNVSNNMWILITLMFIIISVIIDMCFGSFFLFWDDI